MPESVAARFMQLFTGFDGAHGTHGATSANDRKGGKLEIKSSASTVRSAVTEELWRLHLAGVRALGIIPITEVGMSHWGCIDVDQYDLTLSEIVVLVQRAKLPLIVCRSKSGGAHLFMFLKEAVPAAALRPRLSEIAAVLGFGTSEIFPKQTQVLLERGDLGSWLNMPYFGGDATERYCVKENGTAMTSEEFLRAATAAQIAPEELGGLALAPATDVDVLKEAPPCLQHLAAVGFPEGTRNKGLFALAVFLKKKYPNKWQHMLEAANHKFFEPPLPAQEVLQIVKSHSGNKEYQYTCREYPLSAHCNSSLCRTRKYGVGGEDDFPVLSNLSVLKTEPPLWFVDIDGERMEVTTQELQRYNDFHRLCMERIYVCYKMMKQETWLNIVSVAMRNAIQIEAPPEVGLTGAFYELLNSFVVDRQRGKMKEDLLQGQPWEDEEAGRHYFQLTSFMKFLDMARFNSYSRAQVTDRIKRRGGGAHFFNIKGTGLNVWWIPNTVTPVPLVELPPLEREPI